MIEWAATLSVAAHSVFWLNCVNGVWRLEVATH